VFQSGNVVANPGSAWQVKGTEDFNGDGNTDVLLQNVNGDVAVWGMNGAGQMSQTQSAEVADPGPAWQVEGTGDFNQDGKSDIVLQSTDGSVAIWDMNGDKMGPSAVVANPGPAWHVVGTGDLYGDGKSDIVLQNNDGSVAVWEINGNQNQISQSGVIANPGSAWHVEGTGDFNSDGKTDLVLQNNDGSVAVWDMNGSTIGPSGVLANPGPTWSVVGGHIG
jgi:serralysin